MRFDFLTAPTSMQNVPVLYPIESYACAFWPPTIPTNAVDVDEEMCHKNTYTMRPINANDRYIDKHHVVLCRLSCVGTHTKNVTLDVDVRSLLCLLYVHVVDVVDDDVPPACPPASNASRCHSAR